jgi:hypothetical protein
MNPALDRRQVIGRCDIQRVTPPTFTYRAQSAWLINHVVSGVSAGPRAQVCPRVCALCRRLDLPLTPTLPFGVGDHHTWLHQRRRAPPRPDRWPIAARCCGNRRSARREECGRRA